jgi:hypothetical protein
MPPLGCAVVADDEPGPMQTAEIAVDKRVAGLGVVSRALREAEMPLAVLLPRVRLELGVLDRGVWLQRPSRERRTPLWQRPSATAGAHRGSS